MTATVTEISVEEPAWVAAARYVQEHGYAMVHHHEGALMPDEEVPVTCEACEDRQPGEEACRECGEIPYAGAGMILDVVTAHHLTQLWDSLNLKNRAKLAGIPFPLAVRVMWAVFTKAQGEN